MYKVLSSLRHPCTPNNNNNELNVYILWSTQHHHSDLILLSYPVGQMKEDYTVSAMPNQLSLNHFCKKNSIKLLY